MPNFVHSRPEVFLCDVDLCLSLPQSEGQFVSQLWSNQQWPTVQQTLEINTILLS